MVTPTHREVSLASRSKSDKHHSHGPRKSPPTRRDLYRANRLGGPLSQIGTPASLYHITLHPQTKHRRKQEEKTTPIVERGVHLPGSCRWILSTSVDAFPNPTAPNDNTADPVWFGSFVIAHDADFPSCSRTGIVFYPSQATTMNDLRLKKKKCEPVIEKMLFDERTDLPPPKQNFRPMSTNKQNR
eukprot:jgi/Psemu1/49753/gm1.49753_g